jgi:hypothetical protein
MAGSFRGVAGKRASGARHFRGRLLPSGRRPSSGDQLAHRDGATRLRRSSSGAQEVIRHRRIQTKPDAPPSELWPLDAAGAPEDVNDELLDLLVGAVKRLICIHPTPTPAHISLSRGAPSSSSAFLLATPARATLARRRDTISRPGRAPFREIAPSFVPVSAMSSGRNRSPPPASPSARSSSASGETRWYPQWGAHGPEHARVRWSGTIDPE